MTDEALLSYLIVLTASPLAAFFVHFLLARLVAILRISMAPLAVALLAIFVGYLFMAGMAWLFILKHALEEGPLIPAALYGTGVYGGLAFSYFQLFGMTETARRIKILRDLFEQGPISREVFQNRYGSDNMLSLRLERLIAWKQIQYKNGRYFLVRRTFYRIARLIAIWAAVLGFSKKEPV